MTAWPSPPPRAWAARTQSICPRWPPGCRASPGEQGKHFSLGEVRQTIIELEQAFLFVIAAGSGSCLAVMCPANADAGLVAYEMAMLVKRAGPHLVAQPRLSARQTPAE